MSDDNLTLEERQERLQSARETLIRTQELESKARGETHSNLQRSVTEQRTAVEYWQDKVKELEK